MKKLIFIYITLICVSCRRDLLVTVPTDRISTEIYWKTDQDAINAANAIYTYLDGVDALGWDGLSDIAHINTTGSDLAPIDQGIYDALNGRIAQQWTISYKGIFASNYFMEHVDQITTTNTTLINRLKGEVRTLRAYYYLKLVGWYGAVPLVTKTLSIDEAAQLKRDSASVIYDYINTELTAAAALIAGNESAEKGRVAQGTALALKARAMLYAGRYQDAADAAKAVMDLHKYSLYPQYKNLFSYAAENNTEVILNKEFTKDIYSNNAFYSVAPASQVSSIAIAVPTKKIADAYQMNNGLDITDAGSGFDPYTPYVNRDPRMRYSMFVPGDTLPNGTIYNSTPGSGTGDAIGGGNLYATTTGYNIKKYVNKEDLANPGNTGINIILLRYAEVLLTYAEAKTELNQIDQSVYDAINEIRQRADVNMPIITPGLSQTDLTTVIRHERTIELAFEGLHVFDIRRWRTAETVMPGAIQGMTYLKNGVLTTVVNNSFVRSFDPTRDYLWPVPKAELTLDKNLGQNPNW